MQAYQDRVIDLHNDLLSFLAASPDHSPHDTITGSSIEHIREGGISCLGLAIFSETRKGSEEAFQKQYKIFKKVLRDYRDDFSESCSLKTAHIIPAIENCSAFASEDEPLGDVFRRFDAVVQQEKLLYASMTWNSENRFGGGVHTKVGLKKDGEALLDFLSTKIVAIDLSHASDSLAYDTLRYLDEKKSPLRIIASHSNFRSVTDVPRNIPDEIAEQIVERGGVIGLNCIKRFVGNGIEVYLKHIEHSLNHNWQGSIAIGADFFWHAGSSICLGICRQ
jgi:membrane dipeptidase